ncbi:MAG: hypothetical protein DSY80_03750, partial [Desulfocapsa sp.]
FGWREPPGGQISFVNFRFDKVMIKTFLITTPGNHGIIHISKSHYADSDHENITKIHKIYR